MPDTKETGQLKSSVELVTDRLQEWISTFFYYLPNIIMAVIIILIFIWLSRRVRDWTYRLLSKVIKAKTTRVLLSQFFGALVMFLGVVLALSLLGLDGVLQAVLAGAGVAGIAIGLALQFPLANTFSGVFLATEDDVNTGDWVQTDKYEGEVVEIDSRSTKIKEADNNIVVIPNKTFAENTFKNYSLTKEARTSIKASVPYDSDLVRVKKISIETIAHLYPDIDPSTIEFYFTDFRDSSIDLLLRFYAQKTDQRNALRMKSDAIMALKAAFDTNSIKAPFPTRILHNTPPD